MVNYGTRPGRMASRFSSSSSLPVRTDLARPPGVSSQSALTTGSAVTMLRPLLGMVSPQRARPMRRRSLLLAAGILVLLAGSVLGILALLVHHEPGDYSRSAVPPGPERKQASQEFYSKFMSNVCNAILNGYDWNERFTEAQINSYLTEDFISSGVAARALPAGMREPRVTIDANRIRLAFRYGKEPWSTIISLDLHPWVAKKELNVLALEIQGIHAGLLPISAQSLLEQLSEAARRSDIDVTWYRRNGNPVAVLCFQAGQRMTRLARLDLQPGALRVVGQRVETPTLHAAAGPGPTP
jgi:hypothetical protein